MKSLVCLFSIFAFVASMPQEPAAAPVAAEPAAQPAPAAAAAPAAPAAPALPREFFGPGLNNPLALPTNPHQISVARQVVSANPNVRVRVDVDGQVEFTDQFGREVEVLDSFGNNPLDFKEQFETQQEIREFQLEQAKDQAKLQAQQNFLRQLQGGQAGGAAAPNQFFLE